MAQLVFGTKRQITFASDAEFFEALGFLCKNDGTASLHWERNEEQGAWGSEGRIHCRRNIARFPASLSRAFTVGTGSVVHRINCNEYVEYIVTNHAFVFGGTQNQANIRATVPTANMADFDRGLGL